MLLRKLGHGCLLAEEAGARILIDPGCFATGLDGPHDLTAVPITQGHEDHLDFGALASALAAGPAARVIADEASAALPVHDHDNVFAEWICGLFAELSPAGTTVLALDGALRPRCDPLRPPAW
jgi:L-ascorbate metabolism protein UlaG (beta-lactamase superfamily)